MNANLLRHQLAHHRDAAETTIGWGERRYHLWRAARLACQLADHAEEWTRIARSSCPAGCGVWHSACGATEVRHDAPCTRQGPHAGW